jgi:hypothetical protein
MVCALCGLDDQLRKASVVWENGTSDSDGTIGLVGVLGGATRSSGRVTDDLALTERGTLIGATASTGRLHIHEETIAAHKCAPPVLARAPQPFKGLVAIFGWAVGIVTFVLLLMGLNHLGYDLGFHHFKRWSSYDSVETYAAIRKGAIAGVSFVLSSWADSSIRRIRRSEASRYESDHSIWSDTYYCLRDGWLGIPQ